MKVSRKISTIVCDDIREEKSNKFSLMGIYGKDIVFNKLPALLPKLCLAILLEEVQTDLGRCEVTLSLPALDPSILEIEVEPERVGSSCSFFAVFIPFRVKEPGSAKFEVRFGNNKKPSVIHIVELKKSGRD